MHRLVSITFLSEWQVGTGLGDGHLADSMIARDHNGLPWLPGRAVRGALREGARRLGMGRPDLEKAESLFWGSKSDSDQSNTPGLLRISPARLPQSLTDLYLAIPANQRDDLIRDMTCHRMQTALENGRQVKAGSLRTLECGIPGLSFEASLEAELPDGMDEAWASGYFAAVCAAVKSMGGNRSRGLGRCRITLDGATAGPLAMPKPVPALTGGKS